MSRKQFDYSILDNIYVETTVNKRVYFTSEGQFPSVTTVLSKTSNNFWLEAWRQRIGIEKANEISKYATDRGTAIHEYVERYWSGEQNQVLNELNSDNRYVDIKNMTINLINTTRKYITILYGQELPVYSKRLECAGRLDMIGNWNNTLAVIDLKTARKEKKNIGDIRDYFLQCAFYAYAHNELFNTNIKLLVILIAVEDGGVQIFKGNILYHIPELKYRIRMYRQKEL